MIMGGFDVIGEEFNAIGGGFDVIGEEFAAILGGFDVIGEEFAAILGGFDVFQDGFDHFASECSGAVLKKFVSLQRDEPDCYRSLITI
ncbi:hypothetical protein ACQYAD_06655 [Neobacillus sp. SM06]